MPVAAPPRGRPPRARGKNQNFELLEGTLLQCSRERFLSRIGIFRAGSFAG